MAATDEAMIIGQIIDNGKLECDVPALVDTRLLIHANSGGGKSWLLRLIAERLASRQLSWTMKGVAAAALELV